METCYMSWGKSNDRYGTTGEMSMPHASEQFWAKESVSRKMILVVEDDAAIGALLVQLLVQETCYEALLVPDSFEALNVVHDIKPDLLILDYQLPAMNGIQLCDHLHAMSQLEDVLAIVLSARLPTREVEKRSLYWPE